MSSARSREKQFTLIQEILSDTRKYNVCYSPDAKVLIDWHLQTLLTRFPGLSVKYEEYTYNTGRTVGMIQLNGTIPIYYVQVKYNIPVSIWITEQYPNQAPLAYVAPTPNMIIKDGHPHVDKSGTVHTMYIAHWHQGQSDLVGMVTDMANIFSKDPPLYAKAAAPPVVSYPPRMTMNVHIPMQGYSPGPSSGLTTTAYPSPNSYQQPDLMNPRPAAKPDKAVSGIEQMRKDYRETLVKSLAERVQGSLSLLTQSLQPDAATEELNATLKQNASEIEKGVNMLKEERLTYEHNVQTMAVMINQMTEWKSRIGFAQTPDDTIQPEDVFVPEDPLVEQHLQEKAKDLAVEDCLVALDTLLQKEVIGLEEYLKQIKKVCRVQYFARALSLKIEGMRNGQQ